MNKTHFNYIFHIKILFYVVIICAIPTLAVGGYFYYLNYRYFENEGKPVSLDLLQYQGTFGWWTRDTIPNTGLHFPQIDTYPYTGEVVGSRRSGEKYKGKLKEGFREGTWVEWYSDGNKKREANYVKGKLYGLEVEYRKNGNKKKETEYIGDGFHSSSSKSWYENGRIRQKSIYLQNKKEGFFQAWYENGKSYLKKSYKNGKEEGTRTIWYDNGTKMQETQFENGVKHGWRKVWHDNKTPRVVEFYEQGLLNRKKHKPQYWSKDGTERTAEKYTGL